MLLNPESCYQAFLAHDPRFDGVFFIAVKTTKIYCRTVCTARTPYLKNVTFYGNAASAEKAGYRPCLRCRPELAPGAATIDSVSRLAGIALNRIEDGALAEGSLEGLAGEMGISSRHLRRVIESEFGVSPIELAQTQRLLLAKRLLTDTDLPITEVAFASGFASVRRFNALFLERYNLNPTQLRKKIFSSKSDHLTCEIAYRPPFDWPSLLKFLAGRASAGVELVEEDRYMRTANFAKCSGWIVVERSAAKDTLKIQLSNSLAPVLLQVVARTKRLFDTSANTIAIETHLGELTVGQEGLRVPGTFDGFELAVRAILGQQVSVKGASTLSGRLAQMFGESIETPFPSLNLISPKAQKLSGLTAAQLMKIGIPTARARSIIELARAVAEDRLSLEPGADLESTVKALTALPGIGEWTAQYIAMRALSWPDAFPYSDLGIRKALGLTNDKQVLAAAEAWRPWRSYAAMHLWKSLEKKQ
jgi:AraC family transcriptional regulator of adaptative response / DNA-3-methyladenine glycosylase II